MKIIISLALIFVFSLAGFGQTVSKSLKIKKKPMPEYRGRNCAAPAGKAVLEVTFEKTAKIGAVNIVKSSDCTEFDESAVRAADKIIFEPVVQDGEAVTVVKRIVYEYRIY